MGTANSDSIAGGPAWSKTVVIPGAWGLVLGILVFVVLDGPRELWETAASYSWPTVMGRIESVEVSRSTRPSWSEARSEPVQYYTHVKYCYQVGTEIYHGTRIHAIFGSHFLSGANKLKRQFSEGATVPVYYNPADPTRAVLMPGLNMNTLGLVAVILAFVGAATFKFMRRSGSV